MLRQSLKCYKPSVNGSQTLDPKSLLKLDIVCLQNAYVVYLYLLKFFYVL